MGDRIWPTPDGTRPAEANPKTIKIPKNTDAAVCRLVLDNLARALQAEDDRFRSADAKLIAVCAIMPVSMTVLAAFVTFLSSGYVQRFTPGSVTVVTAIGAYLALQFLGAFRAAVNGLGSRAYLATTVDDVAPDNHESEGQYLARTAENLAARLDQHRYGNNDKITQLNVAYAALTNAVAGLLLALVVLALIAGYEAWR